MSIKSRGEKQDIMIKPTNCHACLTQGSYRVMNNFKDIYQCSSCGHVFRHYYGDVNKFHREEYRNTNPNLGDSKFKPKEDRLRHIANTLRVVGEYYSIDNKCLEIGFGDGEFLRTVRPMVKTIDCCEIDDNLAEIARKENFKVYSGDVLQFSGEQYDVVSAYDVLEHVLDIHSFKEKMKELTKDVLIIQVPVNRGLKPPNRPQGFDGHKHIFSPQSFNTLFESDFTLEKEFVSGKDMLAYGPELLTVWRKKC